MADTDNATVALILQLLNEDGQTATADLFGKGKQADGTETDAQMAMRLFLEEEVQSLGAFVTDRTMAISMQTAVCLDAEMCVMAEKQERMAAHDRGLSLSETMTVLGCKATRLVLLLRSTMTIFSSQLRRWPVST